MSWKVFITQKSTIVKEKMESSEESCNNDFCELQQKCYVAILQDSVNDLKLVEFLEGLPKLETDFNYKTLEEKYGEQKEKTVHQGLELEIEERQLEKEKIQEVRTFLQVVLEELIQELQDAGTCESIKLRILNLEKAKEEEDNLMEEVEELGLRVKQLNIDLDRGNIEGYLCLKDGQEQIGLLKDNYENLIHESKIKINYIKQWEQARLDQFKISQNNQEDKINEKIKDYENKIATEHQIHSKIQAYIKEVTEDYQSSIEFWNQKYIDDIKEMKQRIIDYKNTCVRLSLKNKTLAALYKDREKEMREYREIKKAKKLKEEEKARINARATKIQAWWRGVMVRRMIGPYKVKKTKAKGKGKSGKK